MGSVKSGDIKGLSAHCDTVGPANRVEVTIFC